MIVSLLLKSDLSKRVCEPSELHVIPLLGGSPHTSAVCYQLACYWGFFNSFFTTIKSLLPGEEVAGLYTAVTSESPESSAELWAAAQMEVWRSFPSACQALVGQQGGEVDVSFEVSGWAESVKSQYVFDWKVSVALNVRSDS